MAEDKPIPDVVRDFLKNAGSRGGSATTEAKVKQSRENIARARAAKWLYRKFPVLRKDK